MLWCVKFVFHVETSYISAWYQPVSVICPPFQITIGLFIDATSFKKNLMVQITIKHSAIMEYDKQGFHFYTNWCISYVVTTKLNHCTHFRFWSQFCCNELEVFNTHTHVCTCVHSLTHSLPWCNKNQQNAHFYINILI